MLRCDWKNIDLKLANRISNQIWYKQCLKGKFGRGVQICEGGGGGSISAGGFAPEGVQIGPGIQNRGGFKSAVIPVSWRIWTPNKTEWNIILNVLV